MLAAWPVRAPSGMWRTSSPGIRLVSHSWSSRTSTSWTSPAARRRRTSSGEISIAVSVTGRSLGLLPDHEPPGQAVKLLGAARQLLGGGDDLLRRGDGLVRRRRDLLGGGAGLLGDRRDLADVGVDLLRALGDRADRRGDLRHPAGRHLDGLADLGERRAGGLDRRDAVLGAHRAVLDDLHGALGLG